MVRALPLALGLGLAAPGCGSGTGPAPAPVARAIATPPLTADDAPVAQVTVNLPRAIDALRRDRLLSSKTCEVKAAATATVTVWASCIAVQARTIATGSDDERRSAALEQCIAFELLAQLAGSCRLAAAPEVVEAVRGAAVNRLVETDFERRYHTPADLAPQIDLVLKANPWLFHILELRGSSFARFVVPKGAPPELEDKAHALADRLAAELAGQTGLFGVHLFDAAQRIAAGTGVVLDTSDFRPAPHDDLVDAYAAALYGISEVGRASPAFRSPWGWDVVVWTGGNTARERSRDEVVAELFPEVRRRQFLLWANQIGKQLGVHIEVDDATVARLDSGGAR
ncbi:MAG: hypothetical protein E6J90_34600 [Deltaproteobacteria bacterium]|nr:MAG: hypothetical protein E6J90_34600 [Deltaproteobacteria bacterium]